MRLSCKDPGDDKALKSRARSESQLARRKKIYCWQTLVFVARTLVCAMRECDAGAD